MKTSSLIWPLPNSRRIWWGHFIIRNTSRNLCWRDQFHLSPNLQSEGSDCCKVISNSFKRLRIPAGAVTPPMRTGPAAYERIHPCLAKTTVGTAAFRGWASAVWVSTHYRFTATLCYALVGMQTPQHCGCTDRLPSITVLPPALVDQALRLPDNILDCDLSSHFALPFTFIYLFGDYFSFFLALK